MVGWEVVWCGDLEEKVYVDFWWKGTWAVYTQSVHNCDG